MKHKGNPFAQSAHYYRVIFLLPASAVGTAENAFDDIALTVSSFETDEAGGIWTFELLFEQAPDMEEIRRRLIVLSALHGITTPEASLDRLEQQDWLAQVARNFPPLSIGRFFVHGSHVTENVPRGAIAIQVDAGAAFGSGEHGTTRCCLEAVEWLSRKRDAAHVLDMGCGSGILAIAAAKLWKSDVLAVDIDGVAVRVARENIARNRVQAHVDAFVSDGYSGDMVKKRAPYDVILSNILARPLVAFAPQLARSLKGDGHAVLSGLLTSQEQMVLAAHRAQGLKLVKRFTWQEWCTLVIARG